jgi:site-specific recombinase XerD
VMNGGSIYDLKQILGHRDIEMTERYAHLAPDYLKGRTSILNFR